MPPKRSPQRARDSLKEGLLDDADASDSAAAGSESDTVIVTGAQAAYKVQYPEPPASGASGSDTPSLQSLTPQSDHDMERGPANQV